MILKTSYISYIDYTINSYIDAEVFKDIGEKYSSDRTNYKLPKYNSSVPLEVYIQSSLSMTLYAAFAIESFVNLFGSKTFSNSFFEEYLDKLPTYKKFISINEYRKKEKVDTGCEPYQSIYKIFKRRDILVHDKPKEIRTEEEYREMLKNDVFENNTVLISFLAINNYLKKEKIKIENRQFLTNDLEKRIKCWLAKIKIEVSSKYIYGGAKFPNEREFYLFYRRHNGINNTSIKVINGFIQY